MDGILQYQPCAVPYRNKKVIVHVLHYSTSNYSSKQKLVQNIDQSLLESTTNGQKSVFHENLYMVQILVLLLGAVVTMRICDPGRQIATLAQARAWAG